MQCSRFSLCDRHMRWQWYVRQVKRRLLSQEHRVETAREAPGPWSGSRSWRSCRHLRRKEIARRREGKVRTTTGVLPRL